MSIRQVATIAVALSLATPVAAQDVTADTVLATVNGLDITVGHMILARAELPEQFQQVPDEAIFDQLLDQMIQQAAVAEQAGEMSKRGTYALENERRTLLVTDSIRGQLEGAVTEDALRAAYDESFANAEPEVEFNASHILVEAEEAAVDLKSQLDEGADFAELAKEHSTGPSGPNGGELGWFGKGMMVAEFEEAVLGLEAGQVSDPVQTQFGWHVIKLNETRETAAPPFEQVQAQLAQQLQADTVQKIVEDATAAAEVTRSETEVPPSVLSDVSLLED